MKLVSSLTLEGILKDDKMLKSSLAKRPADLLKTKGADPSFSEKGLREALDPMSAAR